jgi:flagellar protein FlaI
MAIHRLENPPLDVPKATIETLDIVLCQGSMFRKKKQVRRCKEITEIVGMTDKGELEINTVFLYNFQRDSPSFSGTSQVYSSIAEKTGMNMTTMGEDLRRRTAVLQAMLDQDIRDYRDFARIVWLFLSRPKYVMANVGDLVQILPGKCKRHETLANLPIHKDEYPEMVDGPAESDAAYGVGSSVSDREKSSEASHVCYIPEPSGESEAATEDSASFTKLVPVSEDKLPKIDFPPTNTSDVAGLEPAPESAEPAFSLPPKPVPESTEPKFVLPPKPAAESTEPGVDFLPEPVSKSAEPDVEIPSEPAPESAEPEVKAAPVVEDDESLFYDVPAAVPSEEEVFGPAEPDPIFEVAPEKDISSFDLYADEQNTESSPEKK